MNIVIIGTGNTATILGRKLKEAGHVIIQVYGRNAKAACKLADELETEYVSDLAVIDRTADLYLIAVSDIAVMEVIQQLELNDKTVVHTAASVSKDILNTSKHYGVFYPLQTLKKGAPHLPQIPIIIDASDKETFELLNNLALTITDKVMFADDQKRLRLHLAAVIVNNFTNHLYALAEQFCLKEGIAFDLLRPLIEETAFGISSMSPNEAQTGPAIRHDNTTIEQHLKLLESHPGLRNFYLAFTESIQRGGLQV